MKNIIFYVYDEKELKTWVDLLAEHDIDWALSTVRNKRNEDKKYYEITASMSQETYVDLCHLAYQQYCT